MPTGLWLNLAIPGAGLLVRGRLLAGLSLTLPALLVVSAFLLAHVVATSTILGRWQVSLLAAYVVLAAIATITHAVLLRVGPVDAQAVQALFKQVAAAHLTNQHSEAVVGAHRLTVLASTEPGAWHVLANVAEAAGNKRVAAKAKGRAKRLESDRDG